MKHNPRIILAVGLSVLIASGPIFAAPSGPSAKSAARLKKYPTSRWLAHYLPDDRYKIAGGVWKYVSTDLDTYYHRPNSPLMLRQPASSVIGFASAQEAEEAGYRPDPSLGGFAAERSGASRSGAVTRPNAVSAARRVTLADGVSSLVVPSGWRILRGTAEQSQFGSSTRDQFLGPAGERLVVQTFTVNAASAPNIDFGQFTNIKFFKSLEGNMDRLSSTLNSTSMVNSQISGQSGMGRLNELKKYRIFGVTLGGIEGVGASAKTKIIGQPNRSYTFGKGAKMWNIEDYSRGRQGALSVVKTLRLR